MKYLKAYEAWLVKPETTLMPNITSDEFYMRYIDSYVTGPNGFNASLKNHEYDEDDFNEIIKILENKCGNFLDELKKLKQYPLFRGVRYVDGTYTRGLYYKTSYTNRRPTDLNADISNFFDESFQDKFGVKIRANGVFASKCPMVSSDYGIKYLFFPIGNYRYFWNTNIHDLFGDYQFVKWYKDYSDSDEAYDEQYGEDPYGNTEGVWSYNGEYYSPCLDDSIIEAKESNIELSKLSEDKVRRLLVWVPEMSYVDFMKNSDEAAKKEIDKIVSEYKEGNLSEIQKQEITFICKDYYLVDVAFYTMFMEYLKLNPS